MQWVLLITMVTRELCDEYFETLQSLVHAYIIDVFNNNSDPGLLRLVPATLCNDIYMYTHTHTYLQLQLLGT